MVSMMDAFPPMTFSPEELCPPQQTISLADTTLSACTSAPSSICDMREGGDEKRPVKKRKSWGQELPVPKTNLPPRYVERTRHLPADQTPADCSRKRAKTEDEKEQRRIERVLRNRQAAQSSRERKRQEVEKLEGEKSAIETQNDNLRQLLMAAEHEKFRLEQKNKKLTSELAALKGGSASNRSSLAPSPNFSAVDFNDPQAIKQEMEDPLFALRTPISLPSDSFSPSISASTDSRSPSPDSLDMGSHAPTTSPDMTQHPAEMLCDLQCQSGVVSSVAMIRPTIHDRAPSTASLSTNNNNNNNNNNNDQRAPSPNMLISSHLFCLTLTSTVYSHLLIPLLQICHSLKTASPLPSNLMTHPTSLRLIRWLILTPANLTTSTTSTRTHSSKTTKSRSSRPTFRIQLLRRLLLCSPALARPLLGATVREMRAERGVALTERKAGGPRGGVGREKSWSRLMMLALGIECICKDAEKRRRTSNKYNSLSHTLILSSFLALITQINGLILVLNRRHGSNTGKSTLPLANGSLAIAPMSFEHDRARAV
ncbi:MAG: hypothetical protein Q9194_006595 [Teloschistes cf. exilis]